jgi:hypothetical protein
MRQVWLIAYRLSMRQHSSGDWTRFIEFCTRWMGDQNERDLNRKARVRPFCYLVLKKNIIIDLQLLVDNRLAKSTSGKPRIILDRDTIQYEPFIKYFIDCSMEIIAYINATPQPQTHYVKYTTQEPASSGFNNQHIGSLFRMYSQTLT